MNAVRFVALDTHHTASPSVLRNDLTLAIGDLVRPKIELYLDHALSDLGFAACALVNGAGSFHFASGNSLALRATRLGQGPPRQNLANLLHEADCLGGRTHCIRI